MKQHWEKKWSQNGSTPGAVLWCVRLHQIDCVFPVILLCENLDSQPNKKTNPRKKHVLSNLFFLENQAKTQPTFDGKHKINLAQPNLAPPVALFWRHFQRWNCFRLKKARNGSMIIKEKNGSILQSSTVFQNGSFGSTFFSQWRPLGLNCRYYNCFVVPERSHVCNFKPFI